MKMGPGVEKVWNGLKSGGMGGGRYCYGGDKERGVTVRVYICLYVCLCLYMYVYVNACDEIINGNALS